MNSQSFLNFLNTKFFGAMNELPLAEVGNELFHLDGCPIYNTRPVRAWLGEHPNRWKGRNSGLMEFPSRSLDFAPLDFF